ncbi:MAG: SLC13 family permease [Flavobacterium sp.]
MAKIFTVKKIALVLFPLLFVLFSTVLNPEPDNPLIGRMIGIAVWMLGWWVTEVVPLAVTSLLPVVLFPVTGISGGAEISKAYFNDTIFLYIGGFMLALAIEKWDVHRRIATRTLMFFGQGTLQIFIGFMVTTSFLSMWMSNTSIALLMLPIAVSVLDELSEIYSEKELGNYRIALLLGVAYASSIGGITTLVGTPTNLVFIKIYEEAFPDAPPVTFATWLIFNFPLYIILIISASIVLYLMYKPKKHLEIIDGSFFKIANMRLGKRSYEQSMVLLVFVLFALLLTFRSDIVVGSFSIPGWSNLFAHKELIIDAVVAAFIAILLFIIPSKQKPGDRLMDWNTALKIPWGIILLFGGGFALEKGFQYSGLTKWLVLHLDSLYGSPVFTIIFMAVVVMVILTMFASNVTVAQAMLPICVVLSVTLQVNALYIMIPVTIAASMSFVLPSSTPPNAIVFGVKGMTMKHMIMPGLILIAIASIVITLMMYYWGSYVFGLTPA